MILKKLANITTLLAIILMTGCHSIDKKKIVADSKTFQQMLVSFYDDATTTPLDSAERLAFKGITFFPINEHFITEAVIKSINNDAIIAMPTSSGKTKYYKEYGILNFILEGKSCELKVYQSDPPIEGYEQSLFLPFRDLTNGKTSYGNGRYIDLEIDDIKNGKLILDFNRAYNPYCAYSHSYNCPITPYTNSLNVAVEAGVSLKQ